MLLQVALALALAAPERCAEILAMADVHGRVAELPRLAAALQPVRQAGRSLLLDAGDGLQGTLEAKLSRGEAVVAAYGALGVDASAVGNHDFDHGRDTLRERIARAPYPFLAANVVDAASGRPPAWKNLHPSRLFRLPAGPVVGVFGIAAADTAHLTMPGNTDGLAFRGEVRQAIRQARGLRARGAEIVIGLVHEGGSCRELSDPDDLSSCDPGAPLFRLARALPSGLVDALLGGHTHAFVNHRVNGVALVQAGSRAEAAGWVTLCAGAPARLHPPLRAREGAAGGGGGGGAPAGGGDAAEVVVRVEAAVAPFIAAAEAERQRLVGVHLARPLTRDRTRTSPLGAAAAQAIRTAVRADFGLVNAGGLRLDLPAGDLRYGQLYEAVPFDDELALVTLTGMQLMDLLGRLASGDKGFPQLAGITFDGAQARTCDGRPIDPAHVYALALNEFLARGGDGTQPALSRLPRGAVSMREELNLRDALLAWLRTATPARVGEPCP